MITRPKPAGRGAVSRPLPPVIGRVPAPAPLVPRQGANRANPVPAGRGAKRTVLLPDLDAYSAETVPHTAMPDEKQIRRKILLRALGSPLVVGPFLLGMTVLAASWALGFRLGLGAFAALAGVLAAGGAFVTRLLFRGETLARKVTDELTQGEQQSQQKSLDALDQHLASADDDPRPETALRDLRALLKALDDLEAEADRVHLATVIEIQSRSQQLFDQCVRSLAQTAKLWQTAQKLRTPAARQPLLDQRERLIAAVQSTVKQLSDTLVGLHTLGSSEDSSTEITRLREELDQSLAMAKTVEARVHSLLSDSPGQDLQQPLAFNPQTKG